jgi:hypothetical protein
MIARDAAIVQDDVVCVTPADSKDSIAAQGELAGLTIDLDFKIGRRKVAHMVKADGARS